MKNTKRRFPLLAFYDRTGIQRYLEKQAGDGWLLSKISALGWQFERMEQKPLHFCVSYFSKASAFDPEPSEQQRSFQDFCEHTGWKLAASNIQMQVFYNEQEVPVPIETEAILELEQIHASAKKSFLSGHFNIIWLGILQMVFLGWRLATEPLSVLASNFMLLNGFLWCVLLLLAGTEIVSYYGWYRKARALAVSEGRFWETKDHSKFRVAVIALLVIAFGIGLISYGNSKMTMIIFASIAITIVVTAMIVGCSELMKKWKLSAKANRTITMVMTFVLSFGMVGILITWTFHMINKAFPDKVPVETYEYMDHSWKQYGDEMPLYIEDLIDTEYQEYSYEVTRKDKSVFVEVEEMRQRPRMDALEQPFLKYTITHVKLPLLYNWCEEAMVERAIVGYGYYESEDPDLVQAIEVDATLWGANKVYQMFFDNTPEKHFLLCFDNSIVEIDFEQDMELNAEQMKIVGEKLGEAVVGEVYEHR